MGLTRSRQYAGAGTAPAGVALPDGALSAAARERALRVRLEVAILIARSPRRTRSRQASRSVATAARR
jgi:hypothetical protein